MGESVPTDSSVRIVGPEDVKLPPMWVGYALSIVFLVLELEVSAEESVTLKITAVVAWSYWLYCVYKFHDTFAQIPGYESPHFSGRAVAMHFIPFYNFYWVLRWPSEIARFVNWRTQSESMKGWLAGLLVFTAVLLGRIVDGFLRLVALFSAGVYISRHVRRAFAAPPVPASAMAPWGVRGPLGL